MNIHTDSYGNRLNKQAQAQLVAIRVHYAVRTDSIAGVITFRVQYMEALHKHTYIHTNIAYIHDSHITHT